MVVLLFFVAYLIRNKVLFGSPLDFGDPVVAAGVKETNSFHTPLWRGLFGFLLSPGKSIFIFAPPIILALAGLRRLAQHSVGLAVTAWLAPLAYLFYYARYTQWEGGYCVGPRYLVAPLALLCLGLGPALAAAQVPAKGWLRGLAWLLFLAGFAVQIIGMSTNFMEDETTGAYYDQQYNYRLTYDPLVSQTRLLVHYAETPGVEPIGRGFDRWVIFLLKVDVSRRLVVIFWGLRVGHGPPSSAPGFSRDSPPSHPRPGLRAQLPPSGANARAARARVLQRRLPRQLCAIVAFSARLWHFIDKIQTDIVTAAMKGKDELRLSVLRMVKTALKNKEIEKIRPLDDAEIDADIAGR